jgi:hypothetical protein
MMSMKGDGQAVSFIEDCAVPLEHLADYTDAVTELFARTAPAAPGTPTPRSAACTSADPQHEGRGGVRAMRASRRRPAISSGVQGLAFRASTATASRARSSTSGCSGRGSSPPSRR